MYITHVWCTVEFTCLHYWTGARGNQEYLKYPHRHKFHVKAYRKVTHDDREIEFIALKESIEHFVRTRWEHKSITLSCEMMARDLIDEFGLSRCEVSEDGENGAIMEVVE